MALVNAEFEGVFSMDSILLEKLAYTRKLCIGTIKSCCHSVEMSIHTRIKERRLACGFRSHKALADVLGVSWQTVQLWEKEDGTAPNRNRIDAVAKALGVSSAWLLHGADIELDEVPGMVKVRASKPKTIYVFGRAMGGFPERIWDEDGGWPPGFSDEFAEVTSPDQNAFLVPIEGESMVPRYNPGEFALVEPNTEPELEDDVLVRFGDGRTVIKKLLSQRGAIRLGSYNSAEIISAPPEHIVWMYYVAHPVPARKIRTRM